MNIKKAKSVSTGDRVSWNSSGGTARGIVRQIVRDGNVPNIPVKVTGTKEEPAARIEIVDDEGKPTGEMVGHKVSTLRKSYTDIVKAAYANDIFTTEMEARARSMDLGLGGAIHVHQYDGQAVYMPGESHSAYLEHYSDDLGMDSAEEEEDERMDATEALRAVVAEIMCKKNEEMTKSTEFESYGKVTKMDDDQRIVYGYASVISKDGVPIVDRQGDIITAEELEKAASQFMLGERTGLTMHKGDPTTTIIHSFPMTNETKKAYEIESPYEAWLIAVKVHDDATWAKVKEGELKDFSIGGAATRRDV
jgi:hypothetical protein